MERIKVIILKVLYGLLFVIVIPLILVFWAKYTADIVRLPVPGNLFSGFILLVAGLILLICGMLQLVIFGKGLPMNAFPPKRFVKNGIYALTRHPIYSGAVLISFGFSVIVRSSSGFWLVCPLLALMIIAYVIGFENERTKSIFGIQDYKTFLSPPPSASEAPVITERLSSIILVFLPWLLVYETFIYLGVPKDAIHTNFAFENSWPVWEFSEIFYVVNFLLIVLVPVVIKSKDKLRLFITDTWFATVSAGIIYFAFPFIVEQRDFVPQSFPGQLIVFHRAIDGGTSALPSFNVIWAFVAAKYFPLRNPLNKWLLYLLASLISISSLTTGNQSLLNVIAGFSIYLLMNYRINVWNHIRLLSERLANSWQEWRSGPVRIINYGFYGGAAGFAGTLIAGFFLGHQYAFAGFVIILFIILGSGLWAQIVEGSSKLLRPYGYYGGVAGLLIAGILAHFIFSINFFMILGSFAMAGPWIQSIGRLRCLVQGCCHGKPSKENIGIRFIHPLSRVNKISGLKGVALHPTQLYSIGCNLVSGLILIRLYSIEMSSAFIIGIYLILNGLGRFVEESFRGEAQTPYWAGMRIYQWIAIVNVLAGALFTTIPGTKPLAFQFNVESLFLAAVMGIIVTIASGVDFPESNRRFARLTSI